MPNSGTISASSGITYAAAEDFVDRYTQYYQNREELINWWPDTVNKRKKSNKQKIIDEFISSLMSTDINKDSLRLIEIQKYQEAVNKELKLVNPKILNDYKVSCNRCGKPIRRSEGKILTDRKGIIVCNECSLSYNYCNDCNRIYHHKCSCKERYGHGIVSHYNANIDPKFKRMNKKDYMFMGFEFELESYNTSSRGEIIDRQYFQDINNSDIFYLKHDGTCNLQLEIVTHPISWEYLKSKNPIDPVFNLSKYLYSGLTDTCGLHVHVNKNIFTPIILYKICKFFKENKTFIQSLSRRPMSNINRWSGILDSERLLKKLAKGTDLDVTSNKHQAINTKNINTVEFRIFRGTLSKTMFSIIIEFIKSIIEFSYESTISNCYNYNVYKEFLSKNKKEYKNIYHFMNVRDKNLCVS